MYLIGMILFAFVLAWLAIKLDASYTREDILRKRNENLKDFNYELQDRLDAMKEEHSE